LLEIIRDQKPDAVLVSGDIYDRAVPPPDAVDLLDDILFRIVLGLKVPVVVISGNHDSPQRLGFGSRLLREQGLHLISSLSTGIQPVELEDEHGPVRIYPIPYTEPIVARGLLEDDDIHDHNTVMDELVKRIKDIHPSGQRSILMAHAFVVGGEESESERPLSFGGAGAIGSDLLSGFNYVALGHLHKPQPVGISSIYYSGSLLKYSFSETHQSKSVNTIEMDATGACKIEKIPLNPRRDVRRIEGMFRDILKGPDDAGKKDDYLLVSLHDKGAILDAMRQLREVYPNVLHIERPFTELGGEFKGFSGDHRRLDDSELFSSFFSQVNNDDLNDKQKKEYISVAEKLRRMEREV